MWVRLGERAELQTDHEMEEHAGICLGIGGADGRELTRQVAQVRLDDGHVDRTHRRGARRREVQLETGADDVWIVAQLASEHVGPDRGE